MAQRTILIHSKAHLCIKNGLLMITVDDRSSTIPLEDIWVVIVESHQTTLTVACMSQLNDAGIGVMICGRDHMPNGLMLPMGAHSRHARIVEDQLAMSLPLKSSFGNGSCRQRYSTKRRFSQKWGCLQALSPLMPKLFFRATRTIEKAQLPPRTLKPSSPMEQDVTVCRAPPSIMVTASCVQASEEQPLAADGSYPKGFTITAFTTHSISSTILLNRSALSSI